MIYENCANHNNGYSYKEKNVLNNIKLIYFNTNKYFNRNKYFIQNTWRSPANIFDTDLRYVQNGRRAFGYKLDMKRTSLGCTMLSGNLALSKKWKSCSRKRDQLFQRNHVWLNKEINIPKEVNVLDQESNFESQPSTSRGWPMVLFKDASIKTKQRRVKDIVTFCIRHNGLMNDNSNGT